MASRFRFAILVFSLIASIFVIVGRQQSIRAVVSVDSTRQQANPSLGLRYVRSLVVAPGDPERLFALTSDGRIWRSVDQGDSWVQVYAADPALTAWALGIDSRPPFTLYLGTEQGIYRSDDEGRHFVRVHTRPARAISVLPGDASELWAGDTTVWRSRDGGSSWGEASNEMVAAQQLGSPIIIVPPQNNPFFVVGLAQSGARYLWRSSGNTFWKTVPTPATWDRTPVEALGLAWDNGNRTLYTGDVSGRLYQSTNATTTDERSVAWTVAYDFGAGHQVVPLAVGQGPSLYVTLRHSSNNQFLRGVRQADGWQWTRLQLPGVQSGAPSRFMLRQVREDIFVNTRGGLWRIAGASGQLSLLAREEGDIVQVAVAPDGRRVAHVVDTQPLELTLGLELRLLEVSSGQVEVITPLQPAVDPASLTTEEWVNARNAVSPIEDRFRGDSLVWSPSGEQLAFLSFHDGASSDLYLYSLKDGSVRRLSDGPAHAYQINWSPDGRSIFYTSASAFDTKAPYQIPVGAWVAAADGSGNRSVFEVDSQSTGETLVAWLDNEQVLVYTKQLRCSNLNLRTVNVRTGATNVILAAEFSSIAYDARVGAALISAWPSLRCQPATPPGIYLWDGGGDQLRQLTATTSSITLDPARPGWLLMGDRIQRVSPTGELSQAGPMPEVTCQYQFGRDTLAWTSSPGAVRNPFPPGLWVTPFGAAPRRIHGQIAGMLLWSADGTTLYFVDESGAGLYSATAPDFRPVWLGVTPPVRSLHRTGASAAFQGCG
jgi:WD40 repeat protein